MGAVPLLVVMPLAAAFLVALSGKRARWAGPLLAVLATLIMVVLSCNIALSVVWRKVIVYKVGNWMPPFGIPMVVDGFSAFMLCLVSFIACMVALYSIDYIKRYTDPWKYYTLFMLLVGGANGVIVSGDIFNLFVYLEIASIAVYALVGFGTERQALEASFKYAVMSTVASIFIFLGIAFLYAHTSTLNMADLAQVIASKGPGATLYFAAALFIMGFGLKMGLVPFHAWLTDAYSAAPISVAALSSGMLLKALGFYALARIFYNVIGINSKFVSIFMALGVASLIVGSLMAFGQTNIRRLLGYSGISQMGFIAIGLAIASPLSILGALFHALNHSLAKTLLFFGTGISEDAVKNREISNMKGALSSEPVAASTTFIAALSMSGVPPFGGFWSKLLIIFACVRSGHPVIAFIMIVASIFTLVYYVAAFAPIVFGVKAPGAVISRKVRFATNAAMLMLAVSIVMAGFLLVPNPATVVMRNAVSALAIGPAYAQVVFGALK